MWGEYGQLAKMWLFILDMIHVWVHFFAQQNGRVGEGEEVGGLAPKASPSFSLSAPPFFL